MSDANELHPVGLVASSVDPTIKSATSAPVGSDPKERFKALGFYLFGQRRIGFAGKGLPLCRGNACWSET